MKCLLIPERDGILGKAAESFAEMWEAVTGIRLEILTTDDGKSDLIVLGSDAVSAYVHSKIIDKTISPFKFAVGSDGYQLKSAVNDDGRKLLFIAGGRPRSLLYGVYRFFELRANCRYFWDGDIIPHAEDIDISALELFEKPRFSYRGLRYFAHRSLNRFQAEHWDWNEWKHELDWIVKRRMNFFMLRIGMDDLFQKAFPEIVHYPENYRVPEAKPRSYDDRTLFWSLQKRGELRRQILQYARELDLIHPEDVGTMSHWYSRTPLEYLNKVKPAFMPQASGGYSDPTGLVWDIRQNANLDAYFKLTETHIREYGSPQMFHTIGLAERRCYEDRESNHQMKLYTYRRIQRKLREKYPDAPLLIGTWDFCMHWSAEEVRSLVDELNPDNTIIFDYTSDNDDESRTFQTWGLTGRFPWIFGIFHAYEPENELRGNYEIIAKRLSLAAEDAQCKGLVFWPENSHTDTLMLDFLAENSWNPSQENMHIESFIDGFCMRRYQGDEAGRMAKLWRRMLPCIKAEYWVGPGIRPEDQTVAHYGCQAFHLDEAGMWNTPRNMFLRAEYRHKRLAPLKNEAESVLCDIEKMDLSKVHEFVKRDIIDLGRCCYDRLLDDQVACILLEIERWLNGEGDGKAILDGMEALRNLELGLLSLLKQQNNEYSLLASMQLLQQKYECNPAFEATLKGNASCHYCRTGIIELIRGLYLPELECWQAAWTKQINGGERRRLDVDFKALLLSIEDAFYATPLSELCR